MLGRLRKWRRAILREAGILGKFLSMSRDETRAAIQARRPLPGSWNESLAELQGVFA